MGATFSDFPASVRGSSLRQWKCQPRSAILPAITHGTAPMPYRAALLALLLAGCCCATPEPLARPPAHLMHATPPAVVALPEPPPEAPAQPGFWQR